MRKAKNWAKISYHTLLNSDLPDQKNNFRWDLGIQNRETLRLSSFYLLPAKVLCFHLVAKITDNFPSDMDVRPEILKNKNKFISNHRERMHDIYRSICWNKNANFLFTKSAIQCEYVQHMHIQTANRLYYYTGNKAFPKLSHIVTQITQPLTAAVVPTISI